MQFPRLRQTLTAATQDSDNKFRFSVKENSYRSCVRYRLEVYFTDDGQERRDPPSRAKTRIARQAHPVLREPGKPWGCMRLDGFPSASSLAAVSMSGVRRALSARLR